MFSGLESPMHLLVVLIIAVLVLGPKRLPEAARGLGSGIRQFKESLEGNEKPAPAAVEAAPAVEAEKAAEALAGSGISCEVVDLRTLAPLDIDTVAASVEKTGRAIVIAEDCRTAGVSAEVMARVVEECFDFLQAPVRRVAAADAPVPCADSLERAALPDAQRIVDAAVQLLREYA